MRSLCIVLFMLAGCGKPRPTPSAPEPRDSTITGPILIEVGHAKAHGDLLVVTVYLTNRERGTSVDFQSWQNSNSSARDDVGNSYRSRAVPGVIDRDIRKILADEGGKVALGSGPLDVQHPRVDILAFDRPAPIASSIVLVLKADNIGTPGGPPIQLFIPSSQWLH